MNLRISAYYKPFKTQRYFHASKAQYKACIGGLGSGKTLSCIWEVILKMVEYPKNVGIIGRGTYQQLKDGTIPDFFDACPEQLLIPNSYNKTENSVLFKNGSILYFRSLDNPKKFKGVTAGVFFLDEGSEVEYDGFLLLAGRLRRQGVKLLGVVGSNPPFEMYDEEHWLYRVFGQKEGYELFLTSTFDNPTLPKEYIESLKELYPDEWLRGYLYGERIKISDGDPVYPMFKSAVHVKALKFSSEFPIMRGWDFGFRNPAVVFAQVIGDRLFILGEIEGKNILIQDFAGKVIEYGNKRFPYAKYIDYCDPAGRQVSDKSDKTTIQILRGKGINAISKPLPINSGLTIIRILMKVRDDGNPGLLVDPSARKLIAALSGGYRYPKKKVGDDLLMPEKDNKYDHLPDALRYLVGNRQEFLVWLKKVKQPVMPKNSFSRLRSAAIKGGNYGLSASL